MGLMPRVVGASWLHSEYCCQLLGLQCNAGINVMGWATEAAVLDRAGELDRRLQGMRHLCGLLCCDAFGWLKCARVGRGA